MAVAAPTKTIQVNSPTTANAAAGAISTDSSSPSERWVKTENDRIDSISTSNR